MPSALVAAPCRPRAAADCPSEPELAALASAAVRELEGTSVFLVGMMGSGKSTVGRLLAQRLGYAHLDTDALVQQTTGRSVSELFAEGEAVFRDAESRVLNEAASYGRLVVSTGGGIVTRKTNWGHLHNGVVVYLDVPLPALAARVAADGVGLRPLLAGAAAGQEAEHALEKLRAVHEARRELYAQADLALSVPLAAGAAETESPLVTTARLVAALAALLAASDTKTRLRSVPRAGSVALEGSSTGPTTI